MSLPMRRPAELVPLIKAKLKEGVAAYREAGKLLLEAKDGLEHGEFKPWIAKNFELSYRTAADYMRAAESKVQSTAHLPLNKVVNDPSTRRNQRREPTDKEVEEQIKEAKAKAEADYKKGGGTTIQRAEPRWNKKKAEWMEKIVKAGYRQLAAQHHPDKGGKKEDMAELTLANKLLIILMDEERQNSV